MTTTQTDYLKDDPQGTGQTSISADYALIQDATPDEIPPTP